MQTPGPCHKANYADEVIRNTNAFLEAPVKTQRCPTDIVYKALAPRANFRAGFGALLLLQLLSFNVARRSAFCRESAFSENVLAPEDEEFKKDVSKPAASAPEIPLDQAAVFLHKPFRDNALCCQIADVLEELIDHVGDDLKIGQGANDRIGRWGFECLRPPNPKWKKTKETDSVTSLRGERR